MDALPSADESGLHRATATDMRPEAVSLRASGLIIQFFVGAPQTY